MAAAREGIMELHRQGRIVGRSLQEIGDELHVSRERVRQVLATTDILRPSCQGRALTLGARRQQKARCEAWDELAREHGFADFAALTQDWGIGQRLQGKEIARRLGCSKGVIYGILRRHGYTPDRYHATNEHFRGVPKTEAHKAALRAAWARKREERAKADGA